jgi:hypothetical protein
MATVDTLLVKIEADMKGLRRDLGKLNKTTTASTERMKRSFSGVGRVAKFVGATIVASLGVRAFRSIVNVGSEVENLKVRLKALFGSAKEGDRAFQAITKFATQVPFSLGELQKGAGSLAAVTKNADELSTALKITANAAAVSGMTFPDAAMNIQRAFSAGANAADGFRERGVLALAGFDAGVAVTSSETIDKFMAAFGPNGKFGQATDDLAKTFSGTMSMLGDSIFNFQASVSDSGLLGSMQKLVNVLKKGADDGRSFADTFGRVLANAVDGLATVIGFVRRNFETLTLAAVSFFTVMAVGKLAAITTAMIAFAGSLAKAKTAMMALNAIVRKGPLMALGIGLVGLIAALEHLGKLENIKEIIKGYTDQFLGLEAAANGAKNAVEGTNNQLKVGIGKPLIDPKQMAELKSIIEGTSTDVERLEKRIATLQDGLEKVGEDGLQGATEALKRLKKELADAKQQMFENTAIGEALMGGLRDVSSGISQGIADILTKSGDGITSFKDKLLGVLNKIIAKLIEAQFEAILFGKSLTGSSGGGGGLLGGLLSSFAPKPPATIPTPHLNVRAGGGTIRARVPTLVGERGPELFVPNTGGSVMNNMNTRGALGGGRSTSITQNFNVSTGVQQTVRAEIMSMMPIIADKTLAAVIQERQRGGEFADALFG